MTMFTQYGPPDEAGWPEGAREKYADACIEHLARYAPNVPGAILEREVLAPPDIERIFGLTGGSIFQGEQGMDQMAFMRPSPLLSGYATPVHGLYLCGAGTHPGGGVMAASGHNAAKRILRDGRLNRVRSAGVALDAMTRPSRFSVRWGCEHMFSLRRTEMRRCLNSMLLKILVGRWRWRLVTDEDRAVATSGESYETHWHALRAAENVRGVAAAAEISGASSEGVVDPLERARRARGRARPGRRPEPELGLRRPVRGGSRLNPELLAPRILSRRVRVSSTRHHSG